ncbi:hypothetical protein [Klebsiella pneumoniae]|uniref:hypothetical protein n=1 Tax=Klebsiella pneumoniae TaxID=573 RepID=UPI00388F3E60
MPDIGKSGRRMSALQKRILIVLAALDERKHMPVATKDIERVLAQGGEKPVYGSNLKSCMQKARRSRISQYTESRNLQLAVELTETGKLIAQPLLEKEKNDELDKKKIRECHVLPHTMASWSEVAHSIEIDGKTYSVFRCAYVIRLNKTNCLQLWTNTKKIVKLEGDALQIGEWYQKCYDAGIHCHIQINEGECLSERSVEYLNFKHGLFTK